MKKFINFILDLFYDISAPLTLLLIITAMSLIIGFSINNMFSKNTLISESKNSYIKENSPPAVFEFNQNQKELPIVKITIPQNSKPKNVAEILGEMGLIKNEKEFIKKIENKKINTGSFEIKIGSSVDEIINIITK